MHHLDVQHQLPDSGLNYPRPVPLNDTLIPEAPPTSPHRGHPHLNASIHTRRPGGRCQDEVSRRGRHSDSHAYVHHTTAPPSRHKSRHSPIQRTISYSERRVTVSWSLTPPTAPFVKSNACSAMILMT